MKQVRVLLAEHSALIRHRIRSVLQLAADMKIAGEVDTVDELIRIARDRAPNVVLIDQDLPGGDGLAAIRTLKQSQPRIEIIVMTDHLDGESALSAIEVGAAGYILKSIPGAQIVRAIREVFT